MSSFACRVPVLTIVSNEQETPEIEVSDDPYNCHRIDVSGVPCLVTLSKVRELDVSGVPCLVTLSKVRE